jgi:hypothetical protein
MVTINLFPNWVCSFGWRWAKEKELSKLLATLFGLKLDILDVDSFFISKIKKKLSYWCLVHLLLARKIMIANFVLAFLLWYFVAVRGGRSNLKAIRKIKTMFKNFLWGGT